MNFEVLLPDEIFRALRGHMLSNRHVESLALVLCGPNVSDDGVRLLGSKLIIPEGRHIKDQSLQSVSFGTDFGKWLLSLLRETGYSLLSCHSHPFSKNASFSPIDDQWDSELGEYLRRRLPKSHYGSLLFGRDNLKGRIFGPDGLTDAYIRIIGNKITEIHTLRPENKTSDHHLEQASRQIEIFGKEGQKRLSRTKVAVVGLGGTGSHVWQQLAHLGVGKKVGVDFDFVESSNLNRLIGATQEDAKKKVPKTDVMYRVAEGLDSGSNTTMIRASAIHAVDQLKTMDVIFSCVDSDFPRAFLNEVSQAYLIPLIDIGFVIEADTGKIKSAAGQVRITTPSGPCLYCLGLDLSEIRSEFLTEDELRSERELGYVEGEAVSAPSVVSMNGTISSRAVTEFLNLLFGFRELSNYIFYDMLSQDSIVRRIHATRDPNCVVCSQSMGKGDLNDFSSWHPCGSQHTDIPIREDSESV